MNHWIRNLSLIVLCCAPLLAAKAADSPLIGTWTLVAADVLLPDGKRAHDYGEAPKGLLIIDGEGHYSLQIYDSSRPKYASGDKKSANLEEYAGNAIGISAHFGKIRVDTAQHVMTLEIEAASFPNQEGSKQMRYYELSGNELSYRVEPRKDGSIPISVWRRVN